MKETKLNVRKMAFIALMAAMLCVLAPFSIPLAGGVPITLAVLVVCFMPYLIGWKDSLISIVLYLLIGAVGIPVFADFSGGVEKLVGPTGGYLVGYLFLALIGGIAVACSEERLIHAVGFALGLVALYALGTAWLAMSNKMTVSAALKVAVLPFIPLDAAKIAVAVAVGPLLKKRTEKFRE